MAYRDFSLEQAIADFQLTETYAHLFPELRPISPDDSLVKLIDTGRAMALPAGSEKARSEFLIAPILMNLVAFYGDRLAVYSGKNLDVSRDKGLVGECDFLLGQGPATMTLRSPLFTIVEAKRDDVESGVGQCIAQMIGAQQFNQAGSELADTESATTIFGCVTTGEIWQFLRLKKTEFTIDRDRFYIDRLDKILGCLRSCLDPALGSSN